MFTEVDLLGALTVKGAGGIGSTRKTPRFRASVIATFNAYLPFYEDVILRRLVAAGCQHNVLLMDAGHCSSELAKPLARPRLAGTAYTLLPIRAPRAFHPKIGLLVGAKQARVVLGSHNVTLSGFGLNREITTRLDIAGAKDPNGPLAIEVWRFLEAWISDQAGSVPREVLDSALMVARRFAPWLDEPEEHSGDVRFIGAFPSGPSLWDKLPLGRARSVERVTALGAFIDQGFRFLRGVQDSLSPEEFVVGIEPDTVDFDPTSEAPRQIRFVDSGGLGKGDGYLHAKALLVEFKDGDCLLATGSPNLSRPAWTNDPSSRNAEAAIVHSGATARVAAKDLGLFTLRQLPSLATEVWSTMKTRLVERPDLTQDPPDPLSGVALIQDDGLAVYLKGLSGMAPDRALGFGASREDVPFDPVSLTTTEYGVHVRADAEELIGLTIVDVLSDGVVIGRALVHDPVAISRHSRTGAQQSFREALDGLSGDSPDIASLIRFAEKLTFDGEWSEAEPTTSSVRDAATKRDSEESDQPIGSLIIEPRSRHMRTTRRGFRPTDLGYILDILIHSLGAALEERSEGAGQELPSEEEQIGADDEDVIDLNRTVTMLETVRTCQRKVRTLVTRMIRQLSKAHDGESAAGLSLQQLLAVLAVLRELRRHDLRLRAEGISESVVPLDERQRLVKGVLALMFERTRDLYEEALRDFGDDPEGDLSMLRGLLLWLAWDSGLDARSDGDSGASQSDQDAWLLGRARLVGLVPIVVADHYAVEEAKKSVLTTVAAGHTETEKAGRWMDAHVRWGKQILRSYEHVAEWARAGEETERGMLAVATREVPLRIRLVRRLSGKNVSLADFGECEATPSRDFVTFEGAAVAVEKLPEIV